MLASFANPAKYFLGGDPAFGTLILIFPDGSFSPVPTFTLEQINVVLAQMHAFRMWQRGQPVSAELQNLIRPPNNPESLPPFREAIKQLVAARRSITVFISDRGSLGLSSMG